MSTQKSLLFCLTLWFSVTGWAATSWQNIQEGLSYTTIELPEVNTWATIHAFQIDPRKIPLELVLARDFQQRSMTAAQFAESTNAVFAVNGGFFDHNASPLGLRVQKQKIVNPIKNISWWGVFGLRHGTPFIQSAAEYRQQVPADLAIQAGPRLVVYNHIVKSLKPGVAERTGVCINSAEQVIIAVTESTPLSLTDFAKALKRSEAKDGLGCVMALNLDGGGSTQLYAKLPDDELSLPGFSSVSDALIIRSRPQ